MDLSMPARNSFCRVVDLGRIGYADACELQQRLVAARKAGNAPDLLLLCEHPPVFTLGRNGRIEHLRVPRSALGGMGVEFHQPIAAATSPITVPGQIVGYPILHLDAIRRDVVWYVRQLEEAMIRASEAFGIAAFRVPGRTGVWTPPRQTTACRRKRNWAPSACTSAAGSPRTASPTTFAPTCDYFDLIVPCGIAGCRATSLEKLLGRPVTTSEVMPRLAEEFGRAFGLRDGRRYERDDLDEWFAATRSRLRSRRAGAITVIS